MDMAKPTIRFKGYQDDWEQRKLGDVAPLRGGYAFKSSEYKKDGTPIVRISNILPDGSIGADFACYDDMENDENISLRNGDALLAMSGATTGKVSILKCKNTDKYYQNQRVGYFKRNIQYNYDFVSTIVRSDLFKEQLMSVLVAGAQPNVSSKEIDSFEFVFPLNIEEQKKIGQYFANLDTLITLHQRKCDETKRLKKYMLQKMFPQNGEKVPEIRFSGFTDDWEQRKVTDLGEIYIGLVTTMTEHYTDKGHLLIRNSDIKDGYFEFGENPIYLDEEFSEQNKSRMHQLGDVITVHTGDIGTSAVIGENEVNSIGFATIVTRPNQEILDSNYFATYLNTDTHKQWAISMATGDGRSNYNLKDYTKLVVPIPEIEEQKKIATCIVNLNSLITLHQLELENLQNIKKFMLGKMFV